MNFITAYAVKQRKQLHFIDENGDPLEGAEQMTEQCHKSMCDINNVLRQYDKTGLITHVNTAQAQYGDFTEVNEYQESLNMVMAAQESFNDLPSEIRKRFANDPGLFIEFVTNPENEAEMIALGLMNPAPEPAQPLEVVIKETAQPAD